MSKQLAIAASASVLAMSAMVLFVAGSADKALGPRFAERPAQMGATTIAIAPLFAD